MCTDDVANVLAVGTAGSEVGTWIVLVGFGQDVKVHLPAQSKVERQVMQRLPIVLHKQSHVIVARGGGGRRTAGGSALQSHCNGNIEVVDHAIAVAILCGEILGRENSAAAEQIEHHARAGILPLSAEAQGMLATHPTESVTQLIAVERSLLRAAEVGAVLQGRETQL